MPGFGSSEMKTVAGFTVTVWFVSQREEVDSGGLPCATLLPQPKTFTKLQRPGWGPLSGSALSRRHLQGPSPQKGPGCWREIRWQLITRSQTRCLPPRVLLQGLPSLAPSSPLWSRNCLKCKAPTCSPMGQAQHSAPGILSVQKSCHVDEWMNDCF